MTPKIAGPRLAALMGIACVFSTAVADELAQNQAFTLTWSAPTQNEDGTPLTDLLGYYIYVGDSQDAMLPLYYTNAGNSSVVLGVGGPGIRYFAVAAVNYDGVESEMTPILSEPVLGLTSPISAAAPPEAAP